MGLASLTKAQLLTAMEEVLRATGATTLERAVMSVQAGASALAEVGRLRAGARRQTQEAESRARIDRLKAAVHAGLDRSKAFHITESGELGAPLAVWSRIGFDPLDATLAAMGFARGARSTRPSLVLPAQDEAIGVLRRALDACVSVPDRAWAEQNQRRSAALDRG